MASSTNKKLRPLRPPSQLEAILEWQLKAAKLSRRFVRELSVIEGRKWRWDFVAPGHMLLIECEGATWVPNRGHTSGRGIARDIEKHNAATLAGWHTLRFTKEMIEDGTALKQIEQFMGER